MSKLSGGSEWALLLAPEPPYPPAGGGAIRTASILHFLASRFRVHLVTFTVGDGSPPGTGLPAGLVAQLDWVRLPVHSRSVFARALRNAGRLLRGVLPLSDRFCGPEGREQVARAVSGRSYELAVVEHFWCASYGETLRRHAGFVVLDMHNIESALHARCARAETGPVRWMHAAFAGRALEQERKWAPRFDLVLTASEADRRLLEGIAPQARTVVYPNAVPLRLPGEGEEEHCIAFSGNLEYHPNRSAVRYFSREVWPRLRRRDARLRWRLIGRNEWAVRRWTAGDPSIETTGPVEDSLAELARVKVVVAPLLAGSGTRVKILEAWAAGRAVVSTRLGAEGLPAADEENLLLADSPAEMEQAVWRLLGDAELRRRLGQAGRRVVEQQLSWPAVWRGLEQNLAECLPSFGPAKIGSDA
ncbi:MAG: glycosyltransferase [Acidobacteria bacterium]|nr:glycosyltransferase [Acidobacteriota bacterium]